MHLDFLECVDLLIKFMPHLKYRAERTFAQEANLVESFLFSARLNEWPNLLGFRHHIILRSLLSLDLQQCAVKLNDLNSLIVVTRKFSLWRIF